MKIAILIPSTSNGRKWKTINDTYLLNHTLKSFLIQYDKEHHYKFYIGIDRNDEIYDNMEIKEKFKKFVSIMKNIDIEFYYMDNVPKGHLTIMWNILFDIALEENNDYFFQCGDDIEFSTKGWVNDCINVLEKNDGIGLVGPINNNPRILTQSFVSKKHKELFGYFFPPELINWFCDDWINEVYKKINRFYPLRNHFCNNVGGQPRYNINNDKTISINFSKKINDIRKQCTSIVERDYKKIAHLFNCV